MEQSEIHKTTDYSLFKRLSHNRKVMPDQIEKLKQEIQRENLLDCHPIIVNEKFEIIAGQHRLEAAKELGVPIYYIIKNNLSKKTTFLNNWITKPGRPSESYEFYANEMKNPYYKWIVDMKRKYHLTTGQIAALTGVAKKRHYGEMLVKGELTFNKTFEQCQDIIEKYVHLKEILCINVPENAQNFNSSRFCLALYKFIDEYDFDWETFIKKVRISPAKFKMYSIEVGRWVNTFIEIYECRRRNTIKKNSKNKITL